MAMAQARESPGIRRVRTAPITAADRGTSRMASTATGASSRRKLMVEMLTAVEYSSGGRMPSRTTWGSSSTAGMKGRKPTTVPPTRRISAGATPIRSLSWEAAAMAKMPRTAMMRRSMGQG